MSRPLSPVTLERIPQQPIAPVEFITMSDLEHQAELLALMSALYAEDAAGSPVGQSRFSANVVSLVAQPQRGRIVLFCQGGLLCGYALLIPYWSNEFGGKLLHVDEIFVVSDARNRGIGTSFFKFVDEERQFEAIALALEVSPGNTRALRLYEPLGFRERTNRVLTYRFGEGVQGNRT